MTTVMTLDEAIRHAEEVAKENEEWYMENPSILGYQEKFYDCKECADEHRQLAEWLKELKSLKENKTGHWIERYIVSPGNSFTVYQCPKCNEISWNQYNYCPECGARVRRQNGRGRR